LVITVREYRNFVTSSENDYGPGQVVEQASGGLTIVEYFDSPARSEQPRQAVTTASLSPYRLDEQTRVYHEDPQTRRWRVGRVIGIIEDRVSGDYDYPNKRTYGIRFPNDDVQLLPEAELRTRCNKLLDDPTGHLALRLNETAFWHSGRAGFVRSVFDQRRACGGMTALLSSAIDLETHQLAVVRRILQDSVQRYLLADEVGLGKTIEAGILIRQFVLDDPQGHRILIVVPETLMQQWRQELRTRFFLDDQLDRTIHLVASHDLNRLTSVGLNAQMIVIDEAHHIAAGAHSSDKLQAAIFNAVAVLSRPLDRKLLLLSATPALHNERGFLAILHLLDPAMYSLDDLHAFQERVQQRQRVAEALSAMKPDEPNLFLEQAVRDIAELAPQDYRLTDLATRLLARLENDPPEDDPERYQLVAQLRSHISETWRLHRRILRTRRTKDCQVLLPGRVGVELKNWASPDHEQMEQALDEWRVVASHSNAEGASPVSVQRLAHVITEAVVCDPSVFPMLVSARLGDATDLTSLALFPDEVQCLREVPVFDGERDLLRRLSHIAENVDVTLFYAELRSAIAPYMQLPLHQSVSVIVFANYPTTADDLCATLTKHFGANRVFRHSPFSTKWTLALNGGPSQILVCDRRAEEGLNLQSRRSVILHSDLPLSANRIEQRMGRLDRFGAGRGILSIIMLAAQSPLLRTWFECLNQALKIFDRSVASLQYLIEAEFSRVWADYLECGAEAIQDATSRLSGPEGFVERELRHIRSQSELDSFEFDPAGDIRFIRELAELDIKSKTLREAADAWIKDRLHFGGRGENNAHDTVLRYQFCRRNDMRERTRWHDTLLGLSGFILAFDRSFERATDAPNEVLYESMPQTFDRQLAQRRFARLARVGDPLIDAFAHGLRTDDRGVSFAIWRYRPDMSELDDPAELSFRFEFVIEADQGPAQSVLEAQLGATTTAIRRRLDESLKPFSETVWLTADLQMIRDSERLELLNAPYEKNWHSIGTVRVRDFNLNHSAWMVVNEWWDSEYWSDLCYRARTASEQFLRAAHELQAVCERAAADCGRQSIRRRDTLESRRDQTSGTLSESLKAESEFECRLAQAMQVGIRQPTIRLDSIGAVFLSRNNPFGQLEAAEMRAKASRFDE
jgi:ATP-dependent helicase HepA